MNSKSHNLMSKKLINKISNIHFELFKKDGYLNLIFNKFKKKFSFKK